MATQLVAATTPVWPMMQSMANLRLHKKSDQDEPIKLWFAKTVYVMDTSLRRNSESQELLLALIRGVRNKVFVIKGYIWCVAVHAATYYSNISSLEVAIMGSASPSLYNQRSRLREGTSMWSKGYSVTSYAPVVMDKASGIKTEHCAID